MKKIIEQINFFRRRKTMKDFFKFSIPCNSCGEEMFPLSQNEFICSNSKCSAIIELS